jgi:hypothetical protein
MPLSTEQWNDLCDAIHKNDCILVLGPNAATYKGEPLSQRLSKHFACLLQLKGITADQCPKHLFELIKLYQNTFADRSTALENIGKVLDEFYDEFSPTDIPVYRALANLPIRYILNTNPDDLAAQALIQKDRKPHFYFYHFFKPEHNSISNAKATDLVDAKEQEDGNVANIPNPEKVIDIDRPLLYNLAGHYSQPDSLVLTDDDRLNFVEKILQTDKGGLPPNLAFHFTNKPRFRMRKTYLFVGFDFNEWHLRMIMHFLRRSQGHLPQTITLQNANTLHPETYFFYDKSFNMVFVDDEPAQFLDEVKERLKKSYTTKKDPKALQLLLLYHENDAPLRQELEKHLATLRNSGLVELWHEGKILAGSNIDQSIAQKLQTADVIVPLITANFMDSDKLYEQDLKIAVTRHDSGKAKLVPILMTPYDLYDTVFNELNTLMPKPRGKALNQCENREEELSKIAAEIRSIIERIKKPIKSLLS